MASTAERRRIVVNADDFGLTAGVNRGILEAFEAGALRSASIMVGMPAFDEAARAAQAAGPALGIGLHLTLTNGRPLASCPTLVDSESGEFLPLRSLFWRLVTRKVRPSEVAEECAAQIARCRAAGICITHLDGHQHVHALPLIRDVVYAVARAERIPFWRRPVEPIQSALSPARRLPQRLLIAFLARTMPREPTARGPREPTPRGPRAADHFAGADLLGSPRPEQLLLRLLDSLRSGTTELMVHPGYVDAPLPGGDSYTEGRERELRGLTSSAVLNRLHRGDIELTHFGAL